MSAQKKPNEQPDPKQKAELFIATYHQAYTDSLAAARAAAQTTATPAWQENYRRQVAAHREVVNGAVKEIHGVCDSIKHDDTSESAEKDIRDAVKTLVDERVKDQAWRWRTVEPYSSTVDKYATQMLAVRRAAHEAEANNPLIDLNLAREVNTIVDQWPVAKWDEETGVVTVTENGSATAG